MPRRRQCRSQRWRRTNTGAKPGGGAHPIQTSRSQHLHRPSYRHQRQHRSRRRRQQPHPRSGIDADAPIANNYAILLTANSIASSAAPRNGQASTHSIPAAIMRRCGSPTARRMRALRPRSPILARSRLTVLIPLTIQFRILLHSLIPLRSRTPRSRSPPRSSLMRITRKSGGSIGRA